VDVKGDICTMECKENSALHTEKINFSKNEMEPFQGDKL
jgi:hypothetical protein